MTFQRVSGVIVACVGLAILFLRYDLPSVRSTVQPPPFAVESALDAYVAEQMRTLEIPGMAVAIVQGDQIYTRGYGVADASGRGVTPQTPFLIASLSKSFTALAIMQLAEAGRIGLDDPVQKHLPWFQVADASSSTQMTVRHLLHQTSGFSEREGYIRNLENDHTDAALETSVRRLRTSIMNHPPGAQFEYSNTNYDILGLLIQTASGQPYERYIQDNIFAPLHMKHAYTSLVDARAGGVSSGYYSFFGFPIVADRLMPYSRTIVPSAGLFASAEDMARYLSVYLQQGVYRDRTLLSPAGVAELLTPGPEIGNGANYAMGWLLFPFPQAALVDAPDNPVPTGISHGGDWTGFKAIMLLVPERELGIVVMMNKSDPVQSSALNNLGWNVALLALGLAPREFPTDDFVTRNYRRILLGVLLLLILGMIWSVWRLSRWPRQLGADARRRRRFVVLLIMLAILDAILAGYLLLVRLPASNDSLPLALRFQPDIGLMYGALLALTLGWGTFRTVWMFSKVIRAPAP